MAASFPASEPRKTCQRGHDWETSKGRNTGNGGYCCKVCQRHVWDGDTPLECSIPGCRNLMRYRSKGWCPTHLARYRKHGDPLFLAKAPNGSGHTNKLGYRELWVDGTKMLEHRSVMEQALGRPLLRSEEVHHINGIRSDNRIENLELWSSSQPSGQRVEDKIAWMTEFLDEYGYEVVRRRNLGKLLSE